MCQSLRLGQPDLRRAVISMCLQELTWPFADACIHFFTSLLHSSTWSVYHIYWALTLCQKLRISYSFIDGETEAPRYTYTCSKFLKSKESEVDYKAKTQNAFYVQLFFNRLYGELSGELYRNRDVWAPLQNESTSLRLRPWHLYLKAPFKAHVPIDWVIFASLSPCCKCTHACAHTHAHTLPDRWTLTPSWSKWEDGSSFRNWDWNSRMSFVHHLSHLL